MTGVVAELEAASEPLFVTHRHADRDTLGSAIGLWSALGRGTVCTPDGIAKPAQPLLAVTDTEPVVDIDAAAFDRIVVLDSPSVKRIAPVDPAEPILVDHHEPGNLSDRASAALVDTEADATAVLVTQLVNDAGWEVEPDAALPLLAGIFGDIGNLSNASGRTVRLVGQLIEALGDRTAELPGLVGKAEDASRQPARTLGSLRADGYRVGEWFVAFSNVGAHETAAGNSLRDLGVDLAVVFSEQSGGYRVTARASDGLADRLSLGDSLLPALASEFGGDGGGHDGAGVATLQTGDREAVEQYILDRLEKRFGTSASPIS